MLPVTIRSGVSLRFKKWLSGILFLLVWSLAGCTTTPSALRYTAQSAVRGSGGVSLAQFSYIPSQKHLVESNELESTALGKFLLDKDIRDFVEGAFAAELERSGLSRPPARFSLNCAIERFRAANLGVSTDWYLDMRCKLVDISTGAEIAAPTAQVIKLHCEKFRQESDEICTNNVIRDAFEQIFSPDILKQIP